jgi:hypothetical protein
VKRFSGVEAGLPRYFALARGAEGPEGHAIPPLEMRKWFDTNYQYQVSNLPHLNHASCLTK